jgi:hypothetical protein
MIMKKNLGLEEVSLLKFQIINVLANDALAIS